VSTLGSVVRELIGLFVDDGALAVEVMAVVALAAMSVMLNPAFPLAAGGILLLGCLGVLVVNVARAVRQR
jgi:hypothetical protein